MEYVESRILSLVKRMVGALALVICMSLAIQPATAYADLAEGTYTVSGLSTAVVNMYHFDDSAARVVVRDGIAWLVTSPSDSSTLNRYDGMAYGRQSDILDASDPTNHTLVPGTLVANVLDEYDEGGALVARTYSLPMPMSVFENGEDIYYVMKYRAGYSGTHDGDWYKASGGDYYLTGYTLAYESDSTLLPGEEPPIDEGQIDLAVYNNASGFALAQAYLLTSADGSTSLVIDTVGGDGHALFVGTLGQALASGEGSWIAGEARDDGTTRFAIPVSSGTSYLPFALAAESLSDVSGTVRPYQFVLDIAGETLTLERYDNVSNVSVSVSGNVAPAFTASSTAKLRVIGGPNDDMFKCVLTLGMDDSAYDYLEYVSLIEGSISVAGTALSSGEFKLVLENSGGKASFSLGQPLEFDVRHADSGAWLTRTLTLDLASESVWIDGSDDSEEIAKALINKLLRDPYSIYADMDGSIGRAEAAYNALSEEAQARLDEEMPEGESVAYGRILENALWAIDAMEHVDSSTTLPDGVYTEDIESSSNMGKSQSSRAKGFKVKSITVRNGHAIATIEHDSTSDGYLRVNGQEYANTNSSGNRLYEVPVDPNSTFHIVWKRQNATESAVGISHEIDLSIDESRTAPDSPLPAENSDSANDKDLQALIDAMAALIASQNGSSKSNSTATPGASSTANAAALEAARAARSNSSTASTATTSANGATEGATPSAQASTGRTTGGATSATGGNAAKAESTGMGATTGSSSGVAEGVDELDPSAVSISLAGVLIALAALGALGFVALFVRREGLR